MLIQLNDKSWIDPTKIEFTSFECHDTTRWGFVGTMTVKFAKGQRDVSVYFNNAEDRDTDKCRIDALYNYNLVMEDIQKALNAASQGTS